MASDEKEDWPGPLIVGLGAQKRLPGPLGLLGNIGYFFTSGCGVMGFMGYLVKF